MTSITETIHAMMSGKKLEEAAEDGHRPTELEKEFAARDAGANLANFGDDEEELEPEAEEEPEEEEEEIKESYEVSRQEILNEAIQTAFRKLSDK
jgi:formylglycine-generating enzyme required for sulfatase activity